MAAKPKLLVLTPDFPPAPGGIQLLVHRLAQNFTQVEVCVVALDSPGAERFDRAGDMNIVRVPRGRLGQPLAVMALNARATAEVVRYRPLVVLSAHIVTSPGAYAIRTALRVPFAQYLHAKELGTKPGLTRFAVKQAEATVAVSRHTEDLARAAGAPEGRLHRICPGVDPPAHPSVARTGRPTILTIARLEDRHKGHDVLARAMPLIRARVPDARWVIVGDGPLRPAIEGLVAAHDLDGAVEFVGVVSDEERDRWFAEAHVFAMPSRLPGGGIGGEGFGIVYLEAAAQGLPVVAGGVGGALDAVLGDETGLLVDPTDHVAVAQAVSDLLLDRPTAERLGRAGVEHARELAWPAIARRLEDEVLLPLARHP